MAFSVLEHWGKTPWDFHIPEEKVDPCYLEAMLCIKQGLIAAQNDSMRTTPRRPH